MNFKEQLPVTYLLFTDRGRIARRTYWLASVFIWSTFYLLYNVLALTISYTATWILYPVLLWVLVATAAKRLHDTDRSRIQLLWILIPVLGAIYLIWLLGFKKGTATVNDYGRKPGSAADYYKNNVAPHAKGLQADERIVNDVTQLNPVVVARVKTPESIEELQTIIRNTDGAIAIGGGRFSMGGQTASKGCTHIDMRQLNKVLSFSPEQKTIKVQAGTRWCDIQKHINPQHLSIKIMQTYANFTVGGALSVNCHGRYIGLGPVILSVRGIEVILANGELRYASPTENSELFYGCIGCYNALGVIATVELDLEGNVPVKREHKKMPIGEYRNYFATTVRDNKEVVFHNGDIYPPDYKRVRAVSWVKTTEKPTEKTEMMPLFESYPVERYFIWSNSETPFGKWRREHIVDPLLYRSKRIHWRNYEAGYDVMELEPVSRKKSTYVLQEYFVPVARFDAFATKMAEIFMRHDVNVLNVSIRHALPDPGSLLAWAREEVFAFVVYHKQKTHETEKARVAVWTRELIDAVTEQGGTYYLPYQPHATQEQFHKAYPNAKKLFVLKEKYDPTFKFRNVLWDTYYTNHKTTAHGPHSSIGV